MKKTAIRPIISIYRYFIAKKRNAIIRVRRFIFKGKTSAPYLSGDAFANLADYAPYGPNGEQSPSMNRLKLARSIFVPSHLLDVFIFEYGRNVTASVLITGNSDHNFVSWPDLPPSITLWMGQNLALTSNAQVKTITIPIGLENLALGRAGLPKYFRSHETMITNKVLVPPMAPSNPIRTRVLNELARENGSYIVYKEYLLEKEYFKLVSKYKFVLCLEGNGFENHRIWETLYRDSFPVLLKTDWSVQLMNLGLPILFITELSDCNETVLEDFLDKNRDFRASNADCLWIEFWRNLVSESVAADE